MKKPIEIQEIEKTYGITLTELPQGQNIFIENSRNRYQLDHKGNVIGLNLSGNQITEIKNLEKLNNLSTLYLSGNKITEIKNLEKLNSISHLDLSENQITEIKNLEKLNNISNLDLSRNQITEIKNLEKLNNISNLNLSNNQITEIKNLEKLTQISNLNLSRNQIREIKNLEKLNNISYLSLSNNQITEIKNLEKLNNISYLNLSGNKITEIKNLEKLNNISTLYLSGNKITEIKNLEKLNNISYLDLSSNQITEIKNLEKLNNISYLDLSENQITEIKNLEKLNNISYLDLSNNQITEIKNLEKLNNISTLNLSGNKITEIKNLEKLNNISTLYLSGNQITEIKNLEKLTQISTLDLSYNLIEDITSLLFYFNKGIEISEFRGISIKNNPLNKPPYSIVEQGREKILEWFEDAKKSGTEPLYEAKLLIVGEPKHGKSSLRKKLLDPSYKIPDNCLRETLGVEIYPNYPVKLSDKDETINVNIWDFGGQEKQYYLHQYFLRKDSVFVLVSDDRKDNTNFDYWMAKLKLFTGSESKILLLFNQINRTTQSSSFNKNKYEELGFNFQDFHLDLSKDNERFSELKNEIDKSIQLLPHIGEEYPRYCKVIANEIDRKKDAEKIDYITIQDFEIMCSNLGYDEKNIVRKALEYLDLIGKIIYYENDTSLNHLIILNPHWLIDAIYGIITCKELEDNNGKFTKKWLDDYLGKPQSEREKVYSKSEIDNILRLMLKNQYDICYTVNDKDYLVPLLMQNNLPENDIDFSDGLQIIFKYEMMPKGLITRLLVRMSDYIFKNLICSQAGILNKDNTFAIVTEHFEKNDANRYIRIATKGDNQIELLHEIRTELIKVQESWFSNMEIIELIPCNCSQCKTSSSPKLFDRKKDLIKRTKNGKFTIECSESFENVEILQLLGAVYDKRIIEFYTGEELERIQKNSRNVYIDKIISGDLLRFGDYSTFEGNQIGGKRNKLTNYINTYYNNPDVLKAEEILNEIRQLKTENVEWNNLIAEGIKEVLELKEAETLAEEENSNYKIKQWYEKIFKFGKTLNDWKNIAFLGVEFVDKTPKLLDLIKHINNFLSSV